MIENVEQLVQSVQQAGSLVQQISDYVKVHPEHSDIARVRFPRGYIKEAATIRRNLRFVEDETLRRNVSYALMSHEVLRWVVFSTDIVGQAREMLIKEAVCLLGSITESITIYPDLYGLGRGSSYRKRIVRLRDMKVIDDEVVELLTWLWDKRNQEHLYDVPFREWNHYEIDDWYRSVKAFRSLRDALLRWKGFEPVA